MDEMTTRAQLESRLRAFKARLVARQALRCAFSALAGASAGLGLGVVFIELLPRLLFAVSLGVEPLIVAATFGAVAAVVWELRRYRMPSLQDAALALEARLDADTGALAAALRVTETDVFFTPVLQRAGQDLQAAEQAAAPVLIRTKRLILVPLLALASGVAFAVVISAEPPAVSHEKQTAKGGNARSWTSIDVGGDRSEADRDAYRKALGMKETAATLNQSAATLRDAAASDDQRNNAVGEAKKALADADSKLTGVTAEELPETTPVTEAERAKLAERIEAAAKGLSTAAAKLEKGEAGSEDTGNTGDFGKTSVVAELVPFPRVQPARETPARVIATQTPARRALAGRALAALERLQDK
jgi:hypothetical protein